MPSFRTGTVTVRAPATSANLGPGFDSLGLALDLRDEVVGRVTDSALLIDVDGEGAAEVPLDEQHLVVQAMRVAFDELGGQPPGLSVICTNRIPHGRGLGSSAAAIVGGIALARALVLDGDVLLSDERALQLADRIEGHPDNVAACLYGGLTVAWREAASETDAVLDGLAAVEPTSSHAAAVALVPDPGVRPVIFIPPFESSTLLARGLLPEHVPHADAARNAGRAALVMAALTGASHVLLAATEDVLHQPYRASGIPQTAALLAGLRAQGVPAVVSGAGPAVLALVRSDAERDQALACTPTGWTARETTVAGPVAVEF